MRRQSHRHSALRAATGAGIALALVAASCGGSRDDEAATDDTVAVTTAPIVTTAPETTEQPDDGASDTTPPATDNAPQTTIADEAFALDLDKCPADWNPTAGVTDDEIKLGVSGPQSGPLAVLQFLALGTQAYFDYANAELGGVDGRQITLISKDDGYEPSRTVTNVTELVENDGVFALVGDVGTPNNLAVWDDLNADCIPHLFVTTGAPQWGDVAGHPWTVGGLLAYPAEAAMWAHYLEQQFPDGASVAVLAFNNDLGRAYEDGFSAAIEGTNIEIVETQRHDQTAPNLNNEVTTLAASGADALLVMTTGDFCPQTLRAVAESSWEPVTLMSATCAAPQVTFNPISPAGDGTLLTSTVKLVTADTQDPDVQFFLDKMAIYAPDVPPTIGVVTQGWLTGEAMYTAMVAAAGMEGGLTRSNVLLATRSLDYAPALLLDGIRMHLDGAVDPFLVESAQLQAWNDATKIYDNVGDLVDFEGRVGEFAATP